jgi:hypothetical protein
MSQSLKDRITALEARVERLKSAIPHCEPEQPQKLSKKELFRRQLERRQKSNCQYMTLNCAQWKTMGRRVPCKFSDNWVVSFADTYLDEEYLDREFALQEPLLLAVKESLGTPFAVRMAQAYLFQNYWLTWEGWRNLGRQVRSGEKSTKLNGLNKFSFDQTVLKNPELAIQNMEMVRKHVLEHFPPSQTGV